MLDSDQSAPITSGHSSLHLSWLHPTGLFGLSMTNFFLRLVTLGIYSFWGKTEARKRIWSGIRIEGEPLQYSGTGKELFLGFLVIFGAILLPIMIISFGIAILFGPESPAQAIFSLLLYPFIFLLIGIGTYRAQRYRLSRTSWRGIRGGMQGSDIHYAWTYFWSAILLPTTLGWLTPWRSTELQKIMTRDARFGDRAFTFTAKPGPLYKSFSGLWFGAIIIFMIAMGTFGASFAAKMSAEGLATNTDARVVIGMTALLYAVLIVAYFCYYILSAWYRSKTINHFSNNTHFEGATFHSTVTGLGLVRVAIGNLLLNITGWVIGLAIFAAVAAPVWVMVDQGVLVENAETLKKAAAIAGGLVLIASSGMFAPIIQARTMRYLVEHLRIDGTVPVGDIAQGAAPQLSRGEGLAQAFDIDGF